MKTFFNKTREQREHPSAEGHVVGAAGNYSPSIIAQRACHPRSVNSYPLSILYFLNGFINRGLSTLRK